MFDLNSCIAFITNNSSKKLSNSFNERLVQKGSTRVQFIALYYLGLSQKINQSELSEKMNIKPSTTARLIDRMEREGYLTRTKCTDDRRVTYLELTPLGKQFRDSLLPLGEEMSKVFSKGITDEEFEIFKRVLNKMVCNSEE
ncbi:hypothetical protein SH2C18_15930 [Clostridium sediminicola]|uniref:MarR family winged helix-turn-helix transcriptional regulator n=1 Tax=Clostridium sediminicola TaxID=3114879 RepID=UPI0031F1E705